MALLRAAVRCSASSTKNYHHHRPLLVSTGAQLSWGGGTGNNGPAGACGKSTAATAEPPRATGKDKLDVTFEDYKAAFKSKTTWELVRAYIVYTMCSFESLVENNMKVSQFKKYT